MRPWQRAMIGLARNPAITGFMQRRATLSALAQRFVGGATVAQAVATAQALAAMSAGGLEVHVSVDPTQLGHLQGPRTGFDNVLRIAAAVPPGGRIMLDIEDFELVDSTLETALELKRRGLPVAQTLQAYLHRTPDDLARLLAQGIAVRLVKGAFAEGAARAVQGREAVRVAYLRLTTQMLAPAARDAGVFPSFATHDDQLTSAIRAAARAMGWPAGAYEFEMLYGVRPELQQQLVDAGEQLRLYLPFGRDWWPYAVRRVGEKPANALLLLRALASIAG